MIRHYHLARTTAIVKGMITAVKGCCCVFFFSGCVEGYQKIKPESMTIQTDSFVNEDSLVVQWRTNILKDSGNHAYYKMEKRNRVSLTLLRIQNKSQRELWLPEDLLFIDSTGMRMFPLTRDQALDALMKPITLGDDPAVEVDMAVWKIGRVVNDAKRVKSHMDFISDMHAYYLEGSVLAPDSVHTGFLALPIESTASFTVQLK